MGDTTEISWAHLPRTTDPRGYVLVRMPNHHRADVRGYVYEHILAAEKSIGRRLRVGERVRHRDANPGNNESANLIVQPPLDRSAIVECACGCGSEFAERDESGRTRRFVSGHNPQKAPTRDALLAILAASPDRCVSASNIIRAIGLPPRAARVALSKSTAAGLVERPRFGYYRLPGSAATFPPIARKRPKSEWGSALPERLKESLIEDFGGLCAYGCGRKATVWDHLIPWALGGRFAWAGNAVPACVKCNCAKNGSAPGPWVYRAFATDYSADAMLGIVDLAISCGMADPEDFDYPTTVPAVAR